MNTSAQNSTHLGAVTERPFLDDMDLDDWLDMEDRRDQDEYLDGFITIGDLADWEGGDGYEDEWDEDDSWLGDYDHSEGADYE